MQSRGVGIMSFRYLEGKEDVVIKSILKAPFIYI